MGLRGISWPALHSWAELTHAQLDPWEAETLFQCSLNYAAYYTEAQRPECPSPWAEARTDSAALMDQIKNMFRGMIRTKSSKDKKK